MPKPVLVVMAAGMGSRYGGLKQIQAVGPHDQALMDYALYDARRAGFEEAVFVISPAMAEQGFEKALQRRVGDHLAVRSVTQDMADIPGGFVVPQGREKPWGTGHAVRACRRLITGPFAVINADDYYGKTSFQAIYDFLSEARQDGHYAMVGYALNKTLSESGYVARGICSTDAGGHLTEIRERTHIIDTRDGPMHTEDGRVYHRLPEDAIASMNLWGFTADFLEAVDQRFTAFLEWASREQQAGAEFFLPEVVGAMLKEGAISVTVLPCTERWYGVTYKEDLHVVVEAIRRMTEEGRYPETLWP